MHDARMTDAEGRHAAILTHKARKRRELSRSAREDFEVDEVRALLAKHLGIDSEVSRMKRTSVMISVLTGWIVWNC
jgi:hypothetical protein